MNKLKKAFCILLTLILIFTFQPIAFAGEANTELKFDKNGEFTILHLTDWHCAYPLPAVHKQLVLEAIAAAKPDFVVLGGDLSEAAPEDQPAAIKEICEILVDAKLPFVITFGNHDYMHDYTIDEMFAFYKEYGGEYFIGTDEKPELFGCGTCSLPVYSNDGSRVAYNIYCFDSGDRTIEDGENKGYDSVHADQIEWYKEKAEELKNENGGQYLPAVVFQHIIVQEIYDKLFPATDKTDGSGVMKYEGKQFQMKPFPNLSNIKKGYTFEHPCPGYHNYGQLDAMSKNGDVRAIFCGHDHYNSFEVEINGVDIVNTPSIKPHILLRKINWGPRVITLHEDGGYESLVLMACMLAENEDSQLVEVGAVSRTELFIVKVWKGLVDNSLKFWEKVTDKLYDF
jgi:predicted phosphodiesterase